MPYIYKTAKQTEIVIYSYPQDTNLLYSTYFTVGTKENIIQISKEKTNRIMIFEAGCKSPPAV